MSWITLAWKPICPGGLSLAIPGFGLQNFLFSGLCCVYNNSCQVITKIVSLWKMSQERKQWGLVTKVERKLKSSPKRFYFQTGRFAEGCKDIPFEGQGHGVFWRATPRGTLALVTQLPLSLGVLIMTELPRESHPVFMRSFRGCPVFLPGESQGRGSLVGRRLWGRTESDTTEAT